MDRCALFVDAGYVLADGAMAVHGTSQRESVSWDYAGLLQFFANLAADRTGQQLLRCYWYEATVDGRRSPEHDTLADLPGLTLRLGRMRPGKREGVETEIHRDLTTLARNRAISDVLLVSAEEDLAQVIADVQDLGVRVIIVHISVDGNWTVSRSLRQQCDDIVEIDGAQLRPYVERIAERRARPLQRAVRGGRLRRQAAGERARCQRVGGGHAALPSGSFGVAPGAPGDLHRAGGRRIPAAPAAGRPAGAAAARAAVRARPGRWTTSLSPAARTRVPARPRRPRSRTRPSSARRLPRPHSTAKASTGKTSTGSTVRASRASRSPPSSSYGAPPAPARSPTPAPAHRRPSPSRPPHAQPPAPPAAPGLPDTQARPGLPGFAAGPRSPRSPSRAPPRRRASWHTRRPFSRPTGVPAPASPLPASVPARFPASSGPAPSAAQAAPDQFSAAPPSLPAAAARRASRRRDSTAACSRRLTHRRPRALRRASARPPRGLRAAAGPARRVRPAVPAGAQTRWPPALCPPVWAPGLGTLPRRPRLTKAPAPAQSAQRPSSAGGDAVQAAHAEGFEFGESVARDAPALWLEAVLARKPRMPSDLEARLLQGSALPIDSLLHDEVRHALRRGFWDALERSRR